MTYTACHIAGTSAPQPISVAIFRHTLLLVKHLVEGTINIQDYAGIVN
jgi:hypothetical protein